MKQQPFQDENGNIIFETGQYIASLVNIGIIHEMQIMIELKDRSIEPILFQMHDIDINDNFELHYKCNAFFPNDMADQEKESWHEESKVIFMEFIQYIVKSVVEKERNLENE